jgi:hypothetical protein
MKAELLLRERRRLRADAFADARIWRVPEPVRGSGHPFKYSIAFVVQGRCLLRYDNEAGKGDHKHMGTLELPYRFVSPERLLADFWRDVAVLEAS